MSGLATSIEKLLTEEFVKQLERQGVTDTKGLPVPVSEVSGGMAGLTFRSRLFSTGSMKTLMDRLSKRSANAARDLPDASMKLKTLRGRMAEARRFEHLVPTAQKLSSEISRTEARVQEDKAQAVAPKATKQDLLKLARPSIRAIAENIASGVALQTAAYRDGKADMSLWNEMRSSGAFIPGEGNKSLASIMKRVQTSHGSPVELKEAELFVAAGGDVMLNGFREAGEFDAGGTVGGVDNEFVTERMLDRSLTGAFLTEGDIERELAGDLDQGAEGFGADINTAAQGFGLAVDDIKSAASGFAGDLDDGAEGFGREDIESGANAFGRGIGLVGLGADIKSGATGFSGDIDDGSEGFGEDIDSGADSFGASIGLAGLGASPGEDDLNDIGDGATDAFIPASWAFRESRLAEQPASTKATVKVARQGMQEALRSIRNGQAMPEVKYRLGRIGIVPPGAFSPARNAGEKAYLEIMRALAKHGYIDLMGNVVKMPKVAPRVRRIERFGLDRMIG